MLSVVIKNYNGKDYLKDALESVLLQLGKTDEVIVVDDNSSDGSVEYIEVNFPKIKLIKNKINVGGAEATNVGLREAKGDIILILDNDIVLEKNAIFFLRNLLCSNKKIGVVGGMVKDYGSSNCIQEIGMGVDIFGYGYSNLGSINGYNNIDNNNYITPYKCFYVSACMMMLKKELLSKVGYFDSSYFIYKDDLDFCWRVHLADMNVWVEPRAKVQHKMGVVLGGDRKYTVNAKKRYFGERNNIVTLFKNYSWYNLAIILPFYLSINFCEVIFFCFTLNFKIALSYFQAWFWILFHFGDILKKRKLVQRIRKIGDYEIIKMMSKKSAKFNALIKIGLP